MLKAIKNHLIRTWKGEEPFWRVFVFWWVLGCSIYFMLLHNLVLFWAKHDLYHENTAESWLGLVLYFVFISFQILCVKVMYTSLNIKLNIFKALFLAISIVYLISSAVTTFVTLGKTTDLPYNFNLLDYINITIIQPFRLV